jgi:hypothetical protein
MALFGKPMSVAAATAAVQSAEERVASYVAERADALTAADAESDFETGLALRNKVPELDRMIDQANIALEHARGNLEAAAKAEADAAIDAKAKAAERDAREAAKLTLEVGTEDAPRMAAKLARIAELNANVDAFNAIRGTRPFVVDGERRVREVPEKHFPTVYEKMTVWVDPETGRKPSQYREVDGELRPADHREYVKRTEKVVSRNEYTVAAHIPGGRFKEGIRLIGLKGEKLFPAGR